MDVKFKEAVEKGEIRTIYCCGITPNKDSHIGHLRVYMLAVLVKLVLKETCKEVKIAINWTDVDQKVIEISGDWFFKVTERIEKIRNHLSRFVSLETIDFQPKVSEHIENIKEDAENMIEKGLALRKRDGIYMIENSHELNGVKSKGSFALWKNVNEGSLNENDLIKNGFPGWHSECSNMISRLFGQVDLHLGGRDLKFPHHVNEDLIHLSVHGLEVSKFWMHFGLINNDRGKIASGNFAYTISELPSPNVTRLYLSYFPFDQDILIKSNSMSQIVSKFVRTIADINWKEYRFLKPSSTEIVNFLTECSLSWRVHLHRFKDVKKLIDILIHLKIFKHTISQRFIVELLERVSLARREFKRRKLYALSDRLRGAVLKELKIQIIDLEAGNFIYVPSI